MVMRRKKSKLKPIEKDRVGMTREALIESTPSLVKPYKPPVLYPQRLVKAREKHKYDKSLRMLKKFHINIFFLETITDMPSYVKFLKDLLFNKGKLLKNAMVSLIEEYSVII